MSKSPAQKAAPKSTLPASIINAVPVSAQIMQHMAAIEKLVPEFTKEMKRAEKGGAVKLARAFVAFHRMQERVGAIWKPIGALFDQYKKELMPNVFEQDGVKGVPLDEGFRVQLSHKFYASIKVIRDEATGKVDDDKSKRIRQEAYNWLRKNGLGDIIQPTVNAQTLSASIKVLMEEQNKEPPSEFFNTEYVPNVSVTAT